MTLRRFQPNCGPEEDSINKPVRPILSGRTEERLAFTVDASPS